MITAKDRQMALSLALLVLATILVGLSSGCAHRAPLPPPPAPPAIEVLVPIAKPCEVQKVEKSALPSALGLPNEIFEAVKRVLADRAILLSDREKLAAANSDPCPEVAK